ncbi:hypothetical protein LZ30DRAFT_693380 [Colletotrichum cereale]|nr:hypothetical protein LZ30DRAFT_693380 [Colletotrichum cereale]
MSSQPLRGSGLCPEASRPAAGAFLGPRPRRMTPLSPDRPESGRTCPLRELLWSGDGLCGLLTLSALQVGAHMVFGFLSGRCYDTIGWVLWGIKCSSGASSHSHTVINVLNTKRSIQLLRDTSRSFKDSGAAY